jgi:hypothetical protein
MRKKLTAIKFQGIIEEEIEEARNIANERGFCLLTFDEFKYNPVKYRVFCKLSKTGWVQALYRGLPGTPKDFKNGFTFIVEFKGNRQMVKFTKQNYNQTWIAIESVSRNLPNYL